MISKRWVFKHERKQRRKGTLQHRQDRLFRRERHDPADPLGHLPHHRLLGTLDGPGIRPDAHSPACVLLPAAGPVHPALRQKGLLSLLYPGAAGRGVLRVQVTELQQLAPHGALHPSLHPGGRDLYGDGVRLDRHQMAAAAAFRPPLCLSHRDRGSARSVQHRRARHLRRRHAGNERAVHHGGDVLYRHRSEKARQGAQGHRARGGGACPAHGAAACLRPCCAA